ncbi:condensation domain-containing protein [Streptomyces sp. NBC_01275]|uniref:condensation domain-containing protein n=1 Tax=Streptomyces sp. NBC_01275 TaxID=2903807 RepID=UPI002255B493|nr:condensation domain-containing protein [Streptomyces sp. NBC_01275]MCX4760222.1 condensation domain-containing protein [Streptomyces sp. NBC_01275]
MHPVEKPTPAGGAAAALLAALTRKRRLDAATPKETGLWLLDRLLPDAGVNNVPFAVRVAGRLDPDTLQTAFDTVVRRHEVLRTVYLDRQAGLVRELLDPDTPGPRVELRATDTDAPHAELRAFAAAPLRCDGTLMLRATVLRGPRTDVLAVAVHHLVFDALSVPLLLGELATAYDAVRAGGDLPEALRTPAPALVPPPPSEDSLTHWRTALAGFDPARLDLDLGSGGVARPTLAGDIVLHVLGDEARDAVRALQRTARAPEAVVLLTAFYLLLAAHGAGPDLVVGSPVNVRPPEAQTALGYHVNTLPLRLTVDTGRSFRALVAETRQVFFGALAHADVPVDAIAHETRRETVSWRDTLFQHMFNYVPQQASGALTVGGLEVQPLHVETGYSKFDLELFVQSGADRVVLRVLYCTETLARADAEALTNRYEALLRAVAAEPDRPVGEFDVWAADDHTLLDGPRGAGTTRTAADRADEADRDHDAFHVAPDGPALSLADAWTAARRTDTAYPYAVHPLHRAHVAVTGPTGRRLPAGVRGEVCLVRADGTHHVPTGWTGRWRHDGALELFGRADRALRTRGRLLHPERVEAALLRHPDVTDARVVTRAGADGTAESLAFVVAPDRPGLADALAAHAARLLPRAAQPARVLRTDELPTRAQGGVDTDALLSLAARQPGLVTDDTDDGLLGDLRKLWCELLGLEEVAADANFFAHGGHSLLGAQLLQRVEQVTGIRIRLADLFDNPTPTALALQVRTLDDAV